MAADLDKKVDLILAKLEKLDVIESRLNKMCTSIASLEEATSNLEKDVTSLKTKTQNNETGVNNLEKKGGFNAATIIGRAIPEDNAVALIR